MKRTVPAYIEKAIIILGDPVRGPLLAAELVKSMPHTTGRVGTTIMAAAERAKL